MKKWIGLTGGLLSAAAVGLGYYISNRIMYMEKKDDEFIKDREIQASRLDLDYYNSLPKEEVIIPSRHGYNIKAVFSKPHNTNRFVIVCHGVTESKYNSIKYMNLFIKLGYNTVIYDQRRHGESGGKSSSYGFFEKDDLKVVVDELIKREGDDVFFGIHGESMGAVTLLLYAGSIEDRANFYIADCPFSDFREQLAHNMKSEIKIPPKWVLPLASASLKLREGYSLREISPISVVQNIQKPVLFIHSADDTFILPHMTKALFDKKQGPKEIFIDFKGKHAQSYNDNPEQYENVIQQFLTDFVEKPEKILV